MLVATLISGVSFSQTADKMSLHNGKTLDVKIVKVDEFVITYKYVDEDAEQTIGKYAVRQIEYGSSGRKEDVSEKITLRGPEDWERVVILEDKAAANGLVKKGEIKGKTAGLMSFHTAGSADKKATKKLREEAAELGAQFILLTSEGGHNAAQMGLGSSQSIKKGLAYSY